MTITPFNNSSNSILHFEGTAQKVGAILPQSSKISFESDLDKKIEKARKHIDYLSTSLPHRNTHGGKRYRARRASINQQIHLAKERLETLSRAKESIRNSASQPVHQETSFSYLNFLWKWMK
ncbi:putative uncharacterized protein [Waddlia chondrophila 2032/99]|uniref:Uncharacterized protein n=2 Tax=Waddlia chondrophila TaxID=71667 RepID=D6YS56_WADCW|nr:hypothetical protein [Waddlia chondrophila]ADI38901.1 hypothetical protein wcw_1553 [Waddlia chondrophila WSU 86-1044]CCB90698.1 putative uncharacterized protein [Waddlia chondrophila 2032/99]